MRIKVAIISLVLFCTNNLYGGFIAITYADKTKKLEVKDRTWESDKMYGIKIGTTTKNNIIFYADYKGTFLFDDPKDETQYSYKIANIGIGFHFDKKFIIMGGAGYTWEVLKDIEGEDSELDNNNLNFNIGMMYYPYDNGLGFLVEYDSIPESVGFGLGYKF